MFLEIGNEAGAPWNGWPEEMCFSYRLTTPDIIPHK